MELGSKNPWIKRIKVKEPMGCNNTVQDTGLSAVRSSQCLGFSNKIGVGASVETRLRTNY
jgi:hypothetical protein